MPVVLFPRLLLQLVSLAVLAAAAWLLWSWWDGYDLVSARGVAYHAHGPAWRLWTGIGLLAWSVGVGRLVVLALLRGGHTPMHSRTAGVEVAAPDGARLHVETSGLSTGPAVILTHGWGLNSTAWGDFKQALGARYRVVAWDLPGLGRSGRMRDPYSLDGFARALAAVVEHAGPGPVLLVGHSIGGMTTQTFFRDAPEALRRRVAGVVLIDTTHQDPTATMWLGGLWRALKAPLIRPLMHLSIWLSPLVWLSSWQGYLSGSNHIVMRLTGFGRFATRGQVELTARLAAKGSPAVQALGNLAMLRWRMTDDLAAIAAPTLVLTGTRDIVTLPIASRQIAGGVPGAILKEVKGCGHMGFMEGHDRYVAETLAFAEQVLPTASALAA